MPKKKKPVDSLKLELNGKALLMLDTDEWGPIELRIDDKETAVVGFVSVLYLVRKGVMETRTVNISYYPAKNVAEIQIPT